MATPTLSFQERNAQILNHPWEQGELLAAQAFEIPQPKPDPLTVALNRFPDLSTYRAYYEGAGNETD